MNKAKQKPEAGQTVADVLKNGDLVKCSQDSEFKEFWYGTYVGLHPRAGHVVLMRARPELHIIESLGTFEFCKPNQWHGG